MRKALMALVAVAMAGPAAAQPSRRTSWGGAISSVDGFNKGDTKTAAAACADQTAIIDEFAPHAWQGTGACLAWMKDYDSDAKKEGITDGIVDPRNTAARRRVRRLCLRGHSIGSTRSRSRGSQ